MIKMTYLSDTYRRGRHSVITYCRMCYARCGIRVNISDGEIEDITGYKNHPLSEGHLCVKGKASKEFILAGDRLHRPLKRTNNGWQEISLQQALEEIARKIEGITDRYGSRSLAVWKGEALGANQQEDYFRRFAAAMETPNYFSNDTLCAVSKKAAISSVIGDYPVPDLEKTDCIVLWGTNPPQSRIMLARKILAARKRGTRLIVIDPRKTVIAGKADLYLPVKPATDGYLALGIIKILIDKGWFDKEFVEKYTRGFAELKEYVRQVNLESVAEETGIKTDDIINTARIIGENAPRSTYMVGVGPEHQDNGFNNIRAIASIGALIGAVDRPGGDYIPQGFGLKDLTLYGEKPPAYRTIGEKEFPVLYDYHREGHSITAMDAILKEEPYPLRALIMAGANPVLTNPGTGKVKRALSDLDLFVVRDLFMTKTARLADYVLPAASFMGRSEIVTNSMTGHIFVSKKICNFSSCQSGYDFWHDLAHLLGIGDYFPWEDENEVNSWLLSDLEIGLQELKEMPAGYKARTRKYNKFREKPLNTSTGRVEFFSGEMEKFGLPPLPEYKTPAYLAAEKDNYPLTLITGARDARYNHSCYHNLPRFKAKEKGPYMEIHPRDAENRGIDEGDKVKVRSNRGTIVIKAKIVGEKQILPGFLQIPHGYETPNVNILSEDSILDPGIGYPAVKSIPVKIKKIQSPG